MGIVRFCKDLPELVDELLVDILDAFSRQDEAIRADIAQRLRELEELERAQALEREELKRRVERLADRWGTLSRHATSRPRAFQLDDEARRRLRDRAEREVIARARDADAGLLGAWEELVRAWAEIASVFGDLGQMLGGGWDLTLSVLRHTGWRNFLRLRQLVEHIPEYRDIVRALGRLHAPETSETVAEQMFVPMRRLNEEWLELPTPLVPEETRGVERSGEIVRMLPVEAAMLGHPRVRLLWHARRWEQALLTYRVEGVDLGKTIVEREATGKAEVCRARRERGPILVIVDTSGSMHGLPEQVAKALVLEALRTAHAEKRRCRLPPSRLLSSLRTLWPASPPACGRSRKPVSWRRRRCRGGRCRAFGGGRRSPESPQHMSERDIRPEIAMVGVNADPLALPEWMEGLAIEAWLTGQSAERLGIVHPSCGDEPSLIPSVLVDWMRRHGVEVPMECRASAGRMAAWLVQTGPGFFGVLDFHPDVALLRTLSANGYMARWGQAVRPRAELADAP